MNTLREAHSQNACYYGDCPDYLIADALTRDSGAMSRSNFRVMQAALKAVNPDAVHIERSNHWACGWIDYLVIDPSASDVIAKADELHASLSNYPVLDEEDFSNEEMEEANEVWTNCYNAKERIEYIRDHASQFEFQSFSDLLQCVRGKYFAGYASELIN